MKKSVIWMMMVVLITLSVGVSCRRSEPPTPSKLIVGYVSSGLTGLAVETMRQQGIAAKHGLEIDYQGFANPQALNQAFFLGKIDINIAAGANVVASQAGTPPKFIYFHPTLLNSVSLLVPQSSAARSLTDLKGKHIAWYGPLSGGGTGFMALCEIEGIDDCRKAFQLVQTTPGTEALLLEKGEVDAAIAFEPIAGKLITSGKYVQILGPFWREWEQRKGVKMEMAGMAAKAGWLEQHKPESQRLVAAWRDTVDYIVANFPAVLASFPHMTNLSTEAELAYARQHLPAIYVREWQGLEASIADQVKTLKRSGLLERDSLDFMHAPK